MACVACVACVEAALSLCGGAGVSSELGYRCHCCFGLWDATVFRMWGVGVVIVVVVVMGGGDGWKFYGVAVVWCIGYFGCFGVFCGS